MSGVLSKGTATATNSTTAISLADRFADVFHVKDFGAVFDNGSHPLSNSFSTLAAAQVVYPNASALTDEIDGVALQDAINHVQALPNGGIIDLPNGIGVLNTTIAITANNVILRGRGVGILHHDVGSSTRVGTTLRWTGASGATVVTIAPVADAVSGQHLSNNGVWGGISINGNSLAGTAWRIASTSNGEYHLGFLEPTACGVMFDTVDLGEWNDPQHNDVWVTGYSQTNSPTGLIIDGTSTGGVEQGNTSFNRFHVVGITFNNGDAVHINFSDHNIFDVVSLKRLPGGTGNAVIWNGSNVSSGAVGYQNVFRFYTSNAPSIARGTSSFTFPSTGNWVQMLDTTNSTPYPTVETGASLFVAFDTRPAVSMLGSTVGVVAHAPDSTATGGNARGTNAVDLQTVRSANTQVASGQQSVILGGSGNTSSGQGSAAWGIGSSASAIYSMAGGHSCLASGNAAISLGDTNTANANVAVALGFQAHVKGMLGTFAFSSGAILADGDSQMTYHMFRGSGNSTSAIRLTSNNSAASTNNVLNLPNNTAASITVDVMAFDTTTVTKNITWQAWSGLLTRGANAASTAVTMTATPTPLSNGTVTGSSISATADTTNGGLNISFTPPTGNTDTWHIAARISTVFVQ